MFTLNKGIQRDLSRQKPYNPVPRVRHVARVLPLKLVSLVLIITITMMMMIAMPFVMMMMMVLAMSQMASAENPP